MDNIIEASSPTASPSPSNHIGVGVPDLDKAVRWYHDLLTQISTINVTVNSRKRFFC